MNDEGSAQVELLSDGNIDRVGEYNFFSADGSQGKALKDQFSSGCTAPPETSENANPSESSDPSASASLTAPTATTNAETVDPSATPSSTDDANTELD